MEAVMIAKTYRQHRFNARFHSLDFVTIDNDARRVDALNERMKALPEDNRFIHSAQPPGTFADQLPRVLERYAPPGKPTLWIIEASRV